jgi:DNA-binding response OmpR family regulator
MKTIASDYAPPKRILYVEENDDSRQMLAITLENAGYAVSTADSIANGLSVTRRERFDLYILENSYRDGSGLNLCRQIRADDPFIPIIFYSSQAYPSDIKAGMAAGAQDYLVQPMGIYSIAETIAGLLTSPVVASQYIN